MNKTAIAAAMLCIAAGFSAPVFADDPCEVVICMFGKATGNSGGDACSSAEKSFFNIVKKNKHGFLPSHTSDARKQFISECKEANPETISTIISKFGRVKK